MRLDHLVGWCLLLVAAFAVVVVLLRPQNGSSGMVVGSTTIQSVAQQSVAQQGMRPSSVEWGPVQKGVRTRLVPHSTQFVLGKPIKFRLELKNVSESVVGYDQQHADIDSMLIRGPDGKAVSYIMGPVSTFGTPKPLRPGKMVTLFEEIDVAEQYYIAKPGRYTVQFRGTFGIPPSNTVTIEVLASKDTPSDGDFVPKLQSILPDGWYFIAGPYAYVQEKEVRPEGRSPVKGVRASMFYSPTDRKGDDVWIEVWQTRREAEVSGQKKAGSVSEYLGKNQWGHIYVGFSHRRWGRDDVLTSSEMEAHWRGVREKIAAALEVRR